jgi:DNA-binding NarL/FixJ family response regulator
MKDKVRVLIVDDHPLFREGMRGRLDRVGEITVVGAATKRWTWPASSSPK